MSEYTKEYEYLLNVLKEKLDNGELSSEGVEALERKVRRIYQIGYYDGRLDGEKYATYQYIQ